MVVGEELGRKTLSVAVSSQGGRSIATCYTLMTCAADMIGILLSATLLWHV